MAKRILLVEDHADTRDILARLLSMRGYTVTRAAGVMEGVAAAKGELFDCLLCDIGLPDGEATAVLNELKARGPIRTIALSGYDMEHDIAAITRMGFDMHLLKPVDCDRIVNAIEGH